MIYEGNKHDKFGSCKVFEIRDHSLKKFESLLKYYEIRA